MLGALGLYADEAYLFFQGSRWKTRMPAWRLWESKRAPKSCSSAKRWRFCFTLGAGFRFVKNVSSTPDNWTPLAFVTQNIKKGETLNPSPPPPKKTSVNSFCICDLDRTRGRPGRKDITFLRNEKMKTLKVFEGFSQLWLVLAISPLMPTWLCNLVAPPAPPRIAKHTPCYSVYGPSNIVGECLVQIKIENHVNDRLVTLQFVPEEDENMKTMKTIETAAEKLHHKLQEIQEEVLGIEKVRSYACADPGCHAAACVSRPLPQPQPKTGRFWTNTLLGLKKALQAIRSVQLPFSDCVYWWKMKDRDKC